MKNTFYKSQLLLLVGLLLATSCKKTSSLESSAHEPATDQGISVAGGSAGNGEGYTGGDATADYYLLSPGYSCQSGARSQTGYTRWIHYSEKYVTVLNEDLCRDGLPTPLAVAEFEVAGYNRGYLGHGRDILSSLEEMPTGDPGSLPEAWCRWTNAAGDGVDIVATRSTVDGSRSLQVFRGQAAGWVVREDAAISASRTVNAGQVTYHAPGLDLVINLGAPLAGGTKFAGQVSMSSDSSLLGLALACRYP